MNVAGGDRLLIVYHGTDGKNAASILATGFQASKNGRLGEGVYFTDSKDVAVRIAKLRGFEFVCTCEIRIRTSIDSDKTGNFKQAVAR